MQWNTFERLAHEYRAAAITVTEAMRPTLERWEADQERISPTP
jgi:hypothetical protein